MGEKSVQTVVAEAIEGDGLRLGGDGQLPGREQEKEGEQGGSRESARQFGYG